MTSFTPKERRRVSVISSRVRSSISTSAFGQSLVSGRRRVPSPAARIMALGVGIGCRENYRRRRKQKRSPERDTELRRDDRPSGIGSTEEQFFSNCMVRNSLSGQRLTPTTRGPSTRSAGASLAQDDRERRIKENKAHRIRTRFSKDGTKKSETDHAGGFSSSRWCTTTSTPGRVRRRFANCSARYTERCWPPVHPNEIIKFLKWRRWYSATLASTSDSTLAKNWCPLSC